MFFPYIDCIIETNSRLTFFYPISYINFWHSPGPTEGSALPKPPGTFLPKILLASKAPSLPGHVPFLAYNILCCVFSVFPGLSLSVKSCADFRPPNHRLEQQFQPFLSHGTHKLITKILCHTKNIFLANLTKNRYNFDIFTPDGYCCFGHCNFFIWQSNRKEVSALTK